MSAIVVVDTSVLLNVLDVPGRNESRSGVLGRLAELIDDGAHLFIPMAAIVEVGNHIAQSPNGRGRRAVVWTETAGRELRSRKRTASPARTGRPRPLPVRSRFPVREPP